MHDYTRAQRYKLIIDSNFVFKAFSIGFIKNQQFSILKHNARETDIVNRNQTHFQHI